MEYFIKYYENENITILNNISNFQTRLIDQFHQLHKLAITVNNLTANFQSLKRKYDSLVKKLNNLNFNNNN